MKGGSNKSGLVRTNTFFANYENKIKNIQPSHCWTYEKLLTEKECDMTPFSNGIESTRKYVEEHFPYDPTIVIPNIPTEEGCKQVVLGTFELIAPYFYYNKMNNTDTFILLAAEHWTEHLNQTYVSCAFKMLLQNQSCIYPIRVLLPNDVEKGLLRANRSPRATLFELCIILQQSKRFEVYQYPQSEGQSYGIYFMKHIPGKGGRRTRKNRRSHKRSRRSRRTKRH